MVEISLDYFDGGGDPYLLHREIGVVLHNFHYPQFKIAYHCLWCRCHTEPYALMLKGLPFPRRGFMSISAWIGCTSPGSC